MKVGNTFVRIRSPKFRKTFFRPKYISIEPLNIKSNGTLTMPSISMYNFIQKDFFHPVTSFQPKDIPTKKIFQPKEFFGRNILSAENSFIYYPHIMTIMIFLSSWR